MSCQLKVIANVLDVPLIQKKLFPDKNTENNKDNTGNNYIDDPIFSSKEKKLDDDDKYSGWGDNDWGWDEDDDNNDDNDIKNAKNNHQSSSSSSAMMILPGMTPSSSSSSVSSTSWLQEVHLSLSPSGEMIVLANEERILYLTQKWDSKDENVSTKYSITHEAMPLIEPGEKITTVFCLPLASHKRSSHGGPEWTCVLVGFSTGFVRIYTESGTLLISQLFNEDPVVQIKSLTYSPAIYYGDIEKHEEIVILYPQTMVTIDGFSLYQTLKACKNQAARAAASGNVNMADMPLLAYKKWGLHELEAANDVTVCGAFQPSNFDLMVSHTIDNKSSLVLSMEYYYVTVGRGPFVNFYHNILTRPIPQLSDVVNIVGQKLKTAFLSAASGWLGLSSGTEVKDKKNPKFEPEVPLNPRHGLYDKRRHGVTISPSPDYKMAATTDSFGRVILLDVPSGVAIRIWKGYRDAQVGWIESTEILTATKKSNFNKTNNNNNNNNEEEFKEQQHFYHDPFKKGRVPRRTMFLVIYAPRRGILEVWSAQTGPRVAAFSVPKTSRLVHHSHGILGLNNATIKASAGSDINRSNSFVLSKIINRPDGVVMIDVDGTVKSLTVPFHLVFSDKNSRKSRETHLMKQLNLLLKEHHGSSDPLLPVLTHLIKDIKSFDVKQEALGRILSYKAMTSSNLRELYANVINNVIVPPAPPPLPPTMDQIEHPTAKNFKHHLRFIISMLNVYDSVTMYNNRTGDNKNEVDDDDDNDTKCHDSDTKSTGDDTKSVDNDAKSVDNDAKSADDDGADKIVSGDNEEDKKTISDGRNSVEQTLLTVFNLDQSEAREATQVIRRRLVVQSRISLSKSSANQKSVSFKETELYPFSDFISCFELVKRSNKMAAVTSLMEALKDENDKKTKKHGGDVADDDTYGDNEDGDVVRGKQLYSGNDGGGGGGGSKDLEKRRDSDDDEKKMTLGDKTGDGDDNKVDGDDDDADYVVCLKSHLNEGKLFNLGQFLFSNALSNNSSTKELVKLLLSPLSLTSSSSSMTSSPLPQQQLSSLSSSMSSLAFAADDILKCLLTYLTSNDVSLTSLSPASASASATTSKTQMKSMFIGNIKRLFKFVASVFQQVQVSTTQARDCMLIDKMWEDILNICSQSENIFSSYIFILIGRSLASKYEEPTGVTQDWVDITLATEKWQRVSKQFQDLLLLETLFKYTHAKSSSSSSSSHAPLPPSSSTSSSSTHAPPSTSNNTISSSSSSSRAKREKRNDDSNDDGGGGLDRGGVALSGCASGGSVGSAAVPEVVTVSLKKIQNGGRAMLPELIGKWLSRTYMPAAVLQNVDKYGRPLVDDVTVNYFSRKQSTSSWSSPFWSPLSSADRRMMDEISGLLGAIQQQLPHTCHPFAIAGNTAWEFLVKWDRDVELTDCLQLALDYLKKCDWDPLKDGLSVMMWQMFIVKRLTSAVMLTEKVGKAPKDRLIRKEVGMSESALMKFIEFTENFLVYLNFSSHPGYDLDDPHDDDGFVVNSALDDITTPHLKQKERRNAAMIVKITHCEDVWQEYILPNSSSGSTTTTSAGLMPTLFSKMESSYPGSSFVKSGASFTGYSSGLTGYSYSKTAPGNMGFAYSSLSSNKKRFAHPVTTSGETGGFTYLDAASAKKGFVHPSASQDEPDETELEDSDSPIGTLRNATFGAISGKLGSSTSLVELALAGGGVYDEAMVKHHECLCLIMKAVLKLGLKSVKIMGLFDSKGRTNCFKPLTHEYPLPFDVHDETVMACRLEFIDRLISSSISTLGDSGVDPSLKCCPRTYRTTVLKKKPDPKVKQYQEWPDAIRKLCHFLMCDTDYVYWRQAELLYLHGYDYIAYEILPQVRDKDELIKRLFFISAYRFKPALFCKDKMLHLNRLSMCSVTLKNWLERIDSTFHVATVPLAFTRELLTYVMQHLPADGMEYRLSEEMMKLCGDYSR